MPNLDQLEQLMINYRLSEQTRSCILDYINQHRIHKRHNITILTHFYRGLPKSNEKDRVWTNYMKCSDLIIDRLDGKNVECDPDLRMWGYWICIMVDDDVVMLRISRHLTAVIPFTHCLQSPAGSNEFYYNALSMNVSQTYGH